MPNGLAWSKHDEQRLATWLQRGMAYDEIGELLDRSESAVKTRAGRLGLVKSRRWAPWQIEYAVANKRTSTADDIAAVTGKSRSGVHQLFDRLGMTAKRIRRGPAFYRFIRSKHRLGWSDADIVAAWNRKHPDQQLKRESLRDHRASLGLGSNRFSKHVRRKVARKTQEQCRRAGVKNLGQIRALAYRQFAERNGWPADLRPRAVQIMNLLYERGPQTRQAIAAATGMLWKGSRKSLVSNDPEGSYLAHLLAVDLVIQLPRLVKGKGRGKSVHLYAVAPHVRRGPTRVRLETPNRIRSRAS